MAGASATAGWLDPVAGYLSPVIVVLFTLFLGRSFGRLAAGFASLGIVGATLSAHSLALSASSIVHSAIAIVAVWICAEIVSRRPLQPGSTVRLKDHPFDLPIDQLSRFIWSRTGDGQLEYVSQSILDYSGRTFDELRRLFTLTHPDDVGIPVAAFARAQETGEAQEYQCRYLSAAGSYEWFAAVLHTQRDRHNRPIRVYGMHWNINKQKRQEEQLRRRNQTLETMNELCPGHMWAALPDGSIEYLNSSLRDYIGNADAPPCEAYFAAIHPDDVAAYDAHWNVLKAGGDPGELEIRMRSTDDAYRWFLYHVKAVSDEGGQLLRWVGVGWDIHDRKSAESRLRTKEEAYRRIVDCVPACVCVGNPDGELVYVNKVGVAALGKPIDDIIGERWMAFIHPDDADFARSQWKAHIAARKPVDVTVRMQQHDGVYRWQHLLAEPLLDDNGDVINWYLIGIEIDEAIKAQEALTAREHQLREITETIPGMIWCTDPQGQPTYVNRRTRDYTGVEVSDLVDLGYQKSIHPDDWDDMIRAFTHAIESGEPYSHVTRLRRKDGTYRWHQQTGEPMRDANGNIVQWYGLSLDIDEPKRAEDRLRQTQAKLARATRIATVAELSASIAHELNQPLTSVIANAQACRRWLGASPPNLPEAKASVDSLIRDARSADETMQSIRALFKRQTFQKRERNVKDMVLEAVRLLREDETKRSAEIDFDFPDDLPPVFVDQIQIQQVLINLISNGIEATENTGRPPTIRIAASAQDEQSVVLEVVDNGSGIRETDSIFDPFVTTKTKGMGIGLAVSRSIVEAHEGRISASNNAGFGATFRVVLPVGPYSLPQQAVEAG
ncbi:PAS domain-containing sensor histidine kinase [Trinickia violacea]|uniref:PAS domain-containing sensor histidine kinase n=1 Tax=Trinickia violacea TaxID=2571746 RepID=UPI001C2FB7F2|nr:PAS domain-containing sensor histidine kinase [Trinickia violacea]